MEQRKREKGKGKRAKVSVKVARSEENGWITQLEGAVRASEKKGNGEDWAHAFFLYCSTSSFLPIPKL